MEITKEVLIDGNLIENSIIKVYYRGKFTIEYSNEVYIVFGYGLGWKNIKEQKMSWNKDCFYAEIKLEDSGELNFCFKNNFGSWDNNNGKDYVVKIESNTSFEDKVINEEIESVEEKSQEEIKNITFAESIEKNKQEEAVSEEVKQENFYIDGRIFNEIKVENNNEDEKTIKDISKKYSKEEKQEKFKRAVDKKKKKSRRQKKIEKNRPSIKAIQSISNEEESLFEYSNNEKNVDKISDIVIDKIVTNELKNNKPRKKRKTKKERSKANLRRYKRNKVRNIIRIISLVVLTAMIIYVTVYFLEKKDMENQTSNLLNSVEIDKSEIVEGEDIAFELTERMLQVRELSVQYPDLKGWIEIEGTNINYPLMQGTDNDYYMNHDYKKEYSRWGSLFLDKAYDWTIPSSNLLIYGHNFSDGVMLSDLLKYADKSFYDAHPTIKVTTPEEDTEYEIIAVFYSRLYYKSEKDVFRYYFFVNAEDEAAYNEFVSNAKAASIYDTGKTAEYGDQLLTLSTCEYSQVDGRFAVVARKVK